MDFFQHQDNSRRKSRWLVIVFLLAVAAIVAAVDLAALFFLGSSGSKEAGPGVWNLVRSNAPLMLAVSAVTALAILGASLFRMAQLRAGGAEVARGVGAVEVPDNPDDFRLKRLRNVVEETALASGLPVPELFVLENEHSINAFAAGNHPSDAAVAVTRGTLERLNRNELQGVIAHELSHVANGDMRLSLRLMGWLFGILFIAIAGRGILRAGAHGGGRRKGNGLAIFGLALVIIGYIGVFAGRLIKAAVSRERERLADASAVQFTRDTTGLAGALKKIGGLESGSVLEHTEAEEVSHMLFASGFASRLLATHPPLIERIRALEPGFDPAAFERIDWRADGAPEGEARAPGLAPLAGPAPEEFTAAASGLTDAHLQSGAALRRAIPETLYETVHTQPGALAVIAGLLLSPDGQVRARQLAEVEASLGEDGRREAERLARRTGDLPAQLRMPLADLAWPRLRHLSPQRLAELGRAIERLIRADGRVSVFEYALSRRIRVLLRDLSNGRERRPVKLAQCRNELGDVFAVLARAGHEGQLEARRAYEAGLSQLLPRRRPDFREPGDWQTALDRALDRMDALPSVIKGELLRALAVTVAHDGRVAPAEAELLRAIGASLHCPMPALPQ